jgi:hypothetical protein
LISFQGRILLTLLDCQCIISYEIPVAWYFKAYDARDVKIDTKQKQ